MDIWELVVNKATVKKRRRPILNEVDVTFGSGEVAAILGPTGCGKSTLVRAIAGLEPLSEGTILLQNSESRVPLSDYHARERGRYVACVLQRPGVFFGRTPSENVEIVLKSRSVSQESIRDAVDALWRLVEFDGSVDRPVDGTFSGGEQARIALARAMALDSHFLVVDEALSAIDAPRRRRILERLAAYHRERNRGLVFVTHDQIDAFMYADKIALMENGRIATFGSTSQVYRRPPNRACGEFLGLTRTVQGRVHTLLDDERAAVDIDSLELRTIARFSGVTALELGQEVSLLVRPEDVSIQPLGVKLDKGEFEAVVTRRIFGGSQSLLVLRAGDSAGPVGLLAIEPPGAKGNQRIPVGQWVAAKITEDVAAVAA